MWTAFQWISKYWKACTETSPSSALGGVLGVLGERVYGGREETEFITSTVRFPWHWPLCLIDSGSSGTWLFRVSLQFLFTIMAWKLSLYPVNVKFFPWDHRYLRFTGTTEGETTAWDISSVFRNYFLVLFCLFVCLTQILVLVYAWVCVCGGERLHLCYTPEMLCVTLVSENHFCRAWLRTPLTLALQKQRQACVYEFKNYIMNSRTARTM